MHVPDLHPQRPCPSRARWALKSALIGDLVSVQYVTLIQVKVSVARCRVWSKARRYMRTNPSGREFAIQVRTSIVEYFGVTGTALTHGTRLNSVTLIFVLARTSECDPISDGLLQM